MSMSVTILAHQDAQDVFHRHYPFWRAVTAESYMVIVPSQQTISARHFACVALGQAGHACYGSIERLRFMLHHFACDPAKTHHFVCEYDAIPIGTAVRESQGLTGIVMANTEPQRFMAPRYVTPPWLIDHQSAVRMSKAAQDYPEIYEEGFADRYLSALAMIAGVPILPFQAHGFSRNTILFPEHREQLAAAIKQGARMFHGIKSDAVLSFIQNELAQHYERIH